MWKAYISFRVHETRRIIRNMTRSRSDQRADEAKLIEVVEVAVMLCDFELGGVAVDGPSVVLASVADAI